MFNTSSKEPLQNPHTPMINRSQKTHRLLWMLSFSLSSDYRLRGAICFVRSNGSRSLLCILRTVSRRSGSLLDIRATFAKCLYGVDPPRLRATAWMYSNRISALGIPAVLAISSRVRFNPLHITYGGSNIQGRRGDRKTATDREQYRKST